MNNYGHVWLLCQAARDCVKPHPRNRRYRRRQRYYAARWWSRFGDGELMGMVR